MLSEVPQEWVKCSLGEVISLEYGKSLPEKTRIKGDFPVYGSAGIFGTHNDYLIESQSIVVGRKGTVGAVYKTSQPFFPIDTTYFVVAKNEINWDWLTALLESLELAKLNEATGVPGLNRENAYKSEVFIPPLKEQHRIAEILSSVDVSIQATQAVIEQAERVKRGLMEELLTGGGLGSEVIERGEVPEGWSESKLEDVCEILDKFRVPLNSDERQMRRGNVPYWGANGVVDYIDEAIFDEPLYEPLLLMPEDGGPFGEARIKPICHKIDEPVWVNNHAHVLRVSGAHREYVYQWYVNKNITDFLVGGTRAKLNQKALRALPILLPPLNEQHRIAEILNDSDSFIAKQKTIVEQQTRTKRGLMDDLLTGKVRTV